mgnify:CR=1 FL=1
MSDYTREDLLRRAKWLITTAETVEKGAPDARGNCECLRQSADYLADYAALMARVDRALGLIGCGGKVKVTR